MFVNLLMFVAPLHMLQIYDRVLISRSEVTLTVLTLLALGLIAIYGILEGVRNRVLVRAGLKFDEYINDRVFRATFTAATRNASGPQVSQAIRDMDNVREFVSGMAVIALCDAPWVPIFIVVGFLLHPLLGFVSLAGAIVILVLAVINNMVTSGPIEEGTQAGLGASAIVSSSVRNADVVHALGMVGAIKRHWEKYHDKALVAQTNGSDKAGILMASSRFTRMALQVLILGVGAYLAIQDEITPGTMIAASIIMGRALAPVDMAVGQWRNVINIRGAYRRLERLLTTAPVQQVNFELPDPTGELVVEDLFITPPGSRSVIVKSINFSMPSGGSLGIIGPSGSGKSSLLRVIVGVWPASRGAVRFDGADVSNFDPEKLGPFIGFMPQSVELFDGTIAENIARFQDVNSEEVVLAAKKADIHKLILKFEDGYDTAIGAWGKQLSGGEKQRIALARALYKSPKIIILDEPNANLDQDGEKALADALIEAKNAGATIIVVSHRQALLAVVDSLIVLNEGMIVNSGKREQVLQSLAG
jgi:PrtD family type I secretion system ABC transporter